MRCRAMQENNGKKTIVWFGSYGIDENGKALRYDSSNTSYSTGKQAVVDSLTQRLSVIKGELWYSANYGLPLFEKTKSKIPFDTHISSIISSHPDVTNIVSFKSWVDEKIYKCQIVIDTVYGKVELSL